MVVELDERTCAEDGCDFTAPSIFFPVKGWRNAVGTHDRCWRCLRRKRTREAEARRRRKHPAKLRASQRRYRAKRRLDPEARRRDAEATAKRRRAWLQTPKGRASNRESQRLYSSLKRERAGGSPGTKRAPRPAPPPADHNFLPIGPVLALVHRRIAAREREMNPLGMKVLAASTNCHESPRFAVCLSLGLASRTLYAWEHAERFSVAFDDVDQILTRDGACLFFELYPRQDGMSEEAADEILGELLAEWVPGETNLLPWAWAGLTGAEWLAYQERRS